jgi:hypothetical protein
MRLIRNAIVLLGALLLIPHCSPCFGKELKSEHLFKIERSKNANIVQYDVQMTPDGRLYAKEPVIAYWVRLAKNGQREDLSFFQRKFAYGFKATYNDRTNTATVEMAAKIGRKIIVEKINDAYQAKTRIDGHPAIIRKIFITSIEGGRLPKVDSIELFGTDIVDGVECYEKIIP